MALQAYINDTILVNNNKCTVVGININIYKKEDYFVTYIEYTITNNDEYWYIDDYLNSNDYYVYKQIPKNKIINLINKFLFIEYEEYYVNKALGDTLWEKEETITHLKYNEYLSKKNNLYFLGYKTQNIKNNNINNKILKKMFNDKIPNVELFHDDNVIKNELSKEKVIKIGKGFIFEDNEYFVIGENIRNTENPNNKREFKLYNNNKNKNYWLKFYDYKYWLCETSSEEEYNNINKKNINKDTKNFSYIDSDYDTTINNEYYCETYKNNGYIYINEKNNNQNLYFKGENIKISELPIIEYKYKRSEPWKSITNGINDNGCIWIIIQPILIMIAIYSSSFIDTTDDIIFLLALFFPIIIDIIINFILKLIFKKKSKLLKLEFSKNSTI